MTSSWRLLLMFFIAGTLSIGCGTLDTTDRTTARAITTGTHPGQDEGKDESTEPAIPDGVDIVPVKGSPPPTGTEVALVIESPEDGDFETDTELDLEVELAHPGKIDDLGCSTEVAALYSKITPPKGRLSAVDRVDGKHVLVIVDADLIKPGNQGRDHSTVPFNTVKYGPHVVRAMLLRPCGEFVKEAQYTPVVGTGIRPSIFNPRPEIGVHKNRPMIAHGQPLKGSTIQGADVLLDFVLWNVEMKPESPYRVLVRLTKYGSTSGGYKDFVKEPTPPFKIIKLTPGTYSVELQLLKSDGKTPPNYLPITDSLAHTRPTEFVVQ